MLDPPWIGRWGVWLWAGSSWRGNGPVSLRVESALVTRMNGVGVKLSLPGRSVQSQCAPRRQAGEIFAQ